MFNRLIGLVLLAAAFFAVRYAVDYYEEQQFVDAATQQINALREEVRAQNSDEPQVIAVQKAASKRAEENINSKGTQKERLETAAGTFLGFYLVNSRERANYCARLGVDIQSFTRAFEQSHTNEYQTALQAIAYGPGQVDELYRLLQSQFALVISQDMEFIASEYNITEAEACQLIADNASTLVTEMHISVMQPAVYATLMSASAES